MHLTYRTTRLIVPLVVATVTMIVAPAVASAETDTVTVTEVATALRGVENSGLVADAIPSTTDINSASISALNGMMADIPKDPEMGVSLAAEGVGSVTIDLPNAQSSQDAKRLPDGIIVYPGSDGSANAVIPTENGVQMLTTIAAADAPTRYDYGVSVPAGGRIVLLDGAASVVDGQGEVVLSVPRPWAKDAHGVAVPTHFEVDGTTLTQVVEHSVGDYAYPVVADPVWLVGIVVVAVVLLRWAVTVCGLGYLSGAAQEAFFHGWVWQRVRQAGREGCVWGLLTGGAGGVARMLIKR